MTPPTVCVVDDDPSMRDALDSLLRSIGLNVELFRSPGDFLARHRPAAPECLVLDVRMPGMSGLDFQRRLTEDGNDIPIVFISGHADVPIAVQAMKAGAIEFLTKPFREQDLLDAIQNALDRDRQRRASLAHDAVIHAAYNRLTAREQEVMGLVVAGQMNKQIAGRLALSEVTVKMHRGRVMRKMSAMSIADLVRMADRLALSLPTPLPVAAPLRATSAGS
ncbi:Response regulator protein TmoT [Alphaproteobacteria bacterium SO-S41]|nr:Response regulator protein TmoT [Alphaproteobacteria bacterium SO-S41]